MERTWRLIFLEHSDVADLAAVPWAAAFALVVRRMLGLTRRRMESVIIQRVRRRGMVVGAEVQVDQEAAARGGIDVAVLPAGSARPAGTLALSELMASGSLRLSALDRSEHDLAALIYTSGTTGRPKGVMLSHGNFLAECRATRDAITTTTEDRFVSLVPFFHVFGLAEGCVVALERGCASVLVPQYSPRVFLDVLRRSHPTVVLAIPTQYSHLVLAARRHPPKLRKPLKYCISGAAPLPVPVIEEFRRKFGTGVMEGFGMTETTAAVALNPSERVKPGSIGQALPGADMKVIGEDGCALAAGVQGELLVRGGMVCTGYYNMPAETKGAFDLEGFLHTGDVGYQDDEGYWYITDRKKDIIIKGGYNIAPREIEDVLLTHPSLKDAAVVGIVDDSKRETIIAYCVREAGQPVAETEVLDHCRRNLAAFKAPDEIVFRALLPRSATGKLLRQELRDDAQRRRRERSER
jgi:long-chain acyl-CoA synthetase